MVRRKEKARCGKHVRERVMPERRDRASDSDDIINCETVRGLGAAFVDGNSRRGGIDAERRRRSAFGESERGREKEERGREQLRSAEELGIVRLAEVGSG